MVLKLLVEALQLINSTFLPQLLSVLADARDGRLVALLQGLQERLFLSRSTSGVTRGLHRKDVLKDLEAILNLGEEMDQK